MLKITEERKVELYKLQEIVDITQPLLKKVHRDHKRYERNVAKKIIRKMKAMQYKRRLELRRQSFYLFRLPDIRTVIDPFEPRTVDFYKPHKNSGV